MDVPRLFWQLKPSRVGESQLQSGAFTDRRHTDVSDKSNAAMEGEFATVTTHQPRGGEQKNEKWNISLQVPAFYL